MSLACDPQTTDRSTVHRLWSVFYWMVSGALALFLLARCQTAFGPAAVSAATTPSASPSVTLALLGDVMLGRDVHPTQETFAYIEPYLDAADLAAANLESPLTRAPVETSFPYMLCAPPEQAGLLAQAGFDLLTLANNHSLDCGEQGMLETRASLGRAGLSFAGPGLAPVYRQINGIQLAFLALDATGACDLEAAGQAVRAAHETGAVVVVSIHWGAEYQSGPTPYQKEIAARLAQMGAALVWGHHPHVLQPAEWTEDGRSLVLYSLGNALFDQGGLANTRQSALALVTIGPDGVTSFRAIPFLIDVPNSQIVEADAESAEIIMRYFEGTRRE